LDAKTEKLIIQAVPVDGETGEKLEPEEVPVARVVEGTAPVTGRDTGERFGSIPATLSRVSDAIEVANKKRSLCINCKHFDQPAWKEHLKTVEGQAFERELRQNFAQDFGINPFDMALLIAMQNLAVCRVFTEINKELTVTRPDYWCQASRAENPAGYWEPITTGDEKLANANYDAILRAASQGK
jgi:hypothetical protein